MTAPPSGREARAGHAVASGAWAGASAPAPSRALSPLEQEVARSLRPEPADVDRLARACRDLVAAAERSARELDLPLRQALVAGSAARETYLPPARGGRLDVDLFLLFDPTFPRDRLAQDGLRLAGALLEASERRYAEHPYLRGTFEGFAVDAVPGFQVERSDRPLTAVDRTPFHHAFLAPRLTPGMRDDVRLLKRFLRTLQVYGADARTEGFSGYLVELLIVRFGSFPGLLQAALGWRVPMRLCPPGPEPSTMPETALVLPDPVDPHRNVASALSRRNLALFLLAVREYTTRPRRPFFDPPAPVELPFDRLLEEGRRRGGEVVVLHFPVPDLVDDILVPQLRKCERALLGPLTRWGFDVLGSSSATQKGQAAVVVEIDRSALATVARHDGPPAGSKEVGKFLEKWGAPSPGRLLGPYVTEEGKLQVDLRRERRGVVELLQHEVPQMGFGRNLQEPVARDGRVVPLADAPRTPALERALRALWTKGLPWSAWPEEAP